MKWQKHIYEKELEKFREKELAKKRERQLSKTKLKAKVVGTIKYGKTTALIKSGRAVGKGLKKVNAESKKRRASLAKIKREMPKSKKGKSSYQKWQENLRSTYKF